MKYPEFNNRDILTDFEVSFKQANLDIKRLYDDRLITTDEYHIISHILENAQARKYITYSDRTGK